jgi:hypothetical protein
VRLLTGLSLTVALCTGLVLSAYAMLACADIGPLPRLGHWSAAVLRSHSGIATGPGLVIVAVLAACLAAVLTRAARSVRILHKAEQFARAMQPDSGPLVIVQDDEPIAYAVAAFRSRIVVSTALLGSLAPGERRVLLEHEESHLRHRHHLYVHAARLAAAANPLLRPVARSVDALVERWADEDAARAVGDRTLAATAVARAALFTNGRGAPDSAVLAASGHSVPDRVRQLMADPARTDRAVLSAVLAASVLSWLSAATTAFWANHVIQAAELFYQRR